MKTIGPTAAPKPQVSAIIGSNILQVSAIIGSNVLQVSAIIGSNHVVATDIRHSSYGTEVMHDTHRRVSTIYLIHGAMAAPTLDHHFSFKRHDLLFEVFVGKRKRPVFSGPSLRLLLKAAP